MVQYQNNAHGLACDGFQIAKDDLREIENAQKRDEAVHELFQNAARILKAMRTNRLLRPIFHKYRRACREILHQKRDEAAQLLIMCDYCESCKCDSNHDLKLIQSELKEIHDKINSLEDLEHLHPDMDETESGSSSDSSSSADSSDQGLNEDDDCSESSSSSSSSSSCDINDMSDIHGI
jgi:hypothetical protein